MDVANGAAWQTTPEILKGLGAEGEAMADRPDGKNINEGCGSEHPEKLMAAVKAVEAYRKKLQKGFGAGFTLKGLKAIVS